MRKTTVVNMRHEKCDVRIDRKTKWGNPFKIGEYGDREEVVRKYRIWIKQLLKLKPGFEKDLLALKGKRLGCWCKPKACHGDVLVELIEGALK